MTKFLFLNLLIFSTGFYLAKFRGTALLWRVAVGTLLSTFLSVYPLW